ncbi:MAG: nucleotidyltransferase domain-containing protein [Candidatus Aenigmarchaeota archaeon]|nr:nucleotidyltransferase domain-containing protein [Candidatus Aenigmarchaeota archaeon]
MVTSHEIKQIAIIAAGHLIAGLDEKELKNINNVILFGSVSQNRACKDSDIDLFFDVNLSKSGQKRMKTKLNKITDDFHNTQIAMQFRLRGIDNKISIQVGRLDEWKELKDSIVSGNILLYGKYQAQTEKIKQQILFSWENVDSKVRGAFLNKMYGYNIGKKHYKGMVERFDGSRIGKAVIIVPLRNKDVFMDVFKKYNIQYIIYEF